MKFYNGYCNSGYGNGFVIDHGNGVYTHYAHMKSLASGIKVGAKVQQGDKLGVVGSTGNSTGAHLHFEISTTTSAGSLTTVYNNNPKDPAFGITIDGGTSGNNRWKKDASGRPYDPDGVYYWYRTAPILRQYLRQWVMPQWLSRKIDMGMFPTR